MKIIFRFILSSTLLCNSALFAQSAAEIQLKLQKLNVTASALYIAAHPDDENTRLLSYLANEKKWRTGYLSLTRGDGGQNLIGTEQSEKLGMIRTQELLAARRIDGAEQFFTRAFDFGFSKNPEETFSKWNRDSVLADMVWVIRNFKPDLIITRFPTDGSGGHGHHTASAILAEEAMLAAADPNKFKEQLKYVQVWQAKRLVWNGFNFGSMPQSDGKDFTKIDIGAFNALLGKSYGEIASTSRSQHRSQGFGVPMQRGAIKETFKYVKGDSVKSNIFEGINDNWSRIPNSKKLEKLITNCINKYNPNMPSASINDLVVIYKELDNIKDDYWRNQKKKEVSDLILSSAGIFIESYALEYITHPNSDLKINVQAINRSNIDVKLLNLKINSIYDSTFAKNLENNVFFNYSTKTKIDENTNYSNPYWLLEKPSSGLFHVNNQMLIGIPNPIVPLNVNYTMLVNGQELKFTKSLKYKWTDPVRGELNREVEVLPIVSIEPQQKNIILTKNEFSKNINISVKAFTKIDKAKLKFKEVKGITIIPSEIEFSSIENNANFNFQVQVQITDVNISADLEPYISIENKEYNSKVERIEYEHIPTQTQVVPVKIKVEKLDIIVKGKRAGYIPGAGDDIPEALKQLGFEVVNLDNNYLRTKSLKDLDVIVAGVRLYNTNNEMQSHYETLMNYVKEGGNYVVQYNTNNFISSISSKVGPYNFTVTRDRITDENADLKIINSDDKILNYPNKILPNDYENWVQERGLYFLSKVDENYRKVFKGNDPNEKESDGILITCQYGKGTFTYTGISFFRQLPAGVPGAYKLFANIISQSR